MKPEPASAARGDLHHSRLDALDEVRERRLALVGQVRGRADELYVEHGCGRRLRRTRGWGLRCVGGYGFGRARWGGHRCARGRRHGRVGGRRHGWGRGGRREGLDTLAAIVAASRGKEQEQRKRSYGDARDERRRLQLRFPVSQPFTASEGRSRERAARSTLRDAHDSTCGD